MFLKFEVQNIYPRIDICNFQRCASLSTSFTIANLDTIPRFEVLISFPMIFLIKNIESMFLIWKPSLEAKTFTEEKIFKKEGHGDPKIFTPKL